MENTFNALIPIFSLILIGYYFKYIEFPSTSFWPLADKFTYYILLPALLMYKIANASLTVELPFTFIYAGISALFIMLLSLMLLNRFLCFNGASFTSIVQGSIRFNAYVFLALISSIYHDQGLVIAAVFISFVIPLINILCIATFALYLKEERISVIRILYSILKNPLIIGCLIGALLNILNLQIAQPLLNIFSILGNAALPLGLLSVGVGLDLKHLPTAKIELFLAVTAKLLLFPLLMYVISRFLGLNPMTLSILVLFAAMPTAISSYILARELGGNLPLMSSIITVQTLMSIATVAIVMQILAYW